MRKSQTMARLLLCGAAFILLPMMGHAEGEIAAPPSDDGQYVDGTQYDLNRTATRADGVERGAVVADTRIPGYNPNTLRPAGDGLGRHLATNDLNMANHTMQNVRAILGNGTMVLTGLAGPVETWDAANKFYVDSAIAALSSRITDIISTTINETTLDQLTAADGLVRVGNSLRADESVVRTTGSQSIGGAKTFTSRAYVNSGQARPMEVRATGAGSVAASFTASGADATTLAVSNSVADGKLITFGHGENASGSFELVGQGIRLTGLVLPEEGADAANKAYVDERMREIVNIVNNNTFIPEAPFQSTSFTHSSIPPYVRNWDMYYYTCYRTGYREDGVTTTCLERRHRAGVYSAIPVITFERSNIPTDTTIDIILEAGNCPLVQHLPLGVKYDIHTFQLDVITQETERYDITQFFPSSWGYVPGTHFHGAGSLTHGCDVRVGLKATSPAEPSWSRSTSYWIGQFENGQPTEPAMPE